MAAAFTLGTFVSRRSELPSDRSTALAVLATLVVVAPACANATTYSLIVSGLGGELAYEQRFQEQARQLADAAQRMDGDAALTTVLAGKDATRAAVLRAFEQLSTKVTPDDQVIVTLLGHGSFDGDQYRFNVPGPDLTEADLAAAIEKLRAKPVLVVNATSASGAVSERWQGADRIVITATKNGNERTATRFGQFWVEALTGGVADTNKDDIVTASEAFGYASRKVADSFKADALLATEHARLEGNAAERFQVARLGTAARVTTNPELNALYARRVGIERELDEVKRHKSTLATDAYYDKLEAVLARLATLQRDIDARAVN
jgi:hypothetical protein